MAAATLPYITVDEYLHTTYEPDADYVDGQIEERRMGEWDHGDLQSELVTLFRNHSKAWGIRAATEIRVQTSRTRFRVPDVCVISASNARQQIVRTPPLLCIEILSPEDRFARTLRKFDDYLSMGVPEVWIFDPATRIVLVRRLGTQTEHREGVLTLAGTPIAINLAEVFSVLDEN